MQGGRVIPLDKVQDRDTASVGAKAHALARLMRFGLPVPFGFCITGAAYRERVISGDLAARIGDAVRGPVDGSLEEKVKGLSELREAIAGAPITGALREEIEAAWRALAADRVAVRSSATAEDLPGSSFAGQYESHLGIAALEDCLAAIRKCWASLWTERAFDYRARKGIDHLTVDMAVIVQELVPAEASGVLFTADPVSGARDRLVIEGGFGLGGAVASGKVSPDRVVVLKEELRVIERTVSEKTIEVVPDERGGVMERPVPTAHSRTGRAERSAIGDVTALRLTVLGVRAEREFGCPLDLEWAVCSGDVSILQCRPITALPADPKSRPGGIVRRLTGLLRRDTAEAPARAEADRPRAREKGPTGTAATAESLVATEESAPAAEAVSPAEIEKRAPAAPPEPKGEPSRDKEGRQVWTRANTAEVVPDAMTPMTWSVAEPIVRRLFGSLFGRIVARFEEYPLFDLIAGRAYFNLNTFVASLRSVPGARKKDFRELFGGRAAPGPSDVAASSGQRRRPDQARHRGRAGEGAGTATWTPPRGGVVIPEEDIPDLGVGQLRAAFGVLVVLHDLLTHSPAAGRRFVRRMREETDALYAVDLRTLSDEELARRCVATVERILGGRHSYIFVGVGLLCGLALSNVSVRFFGEEGDAIAARLLSGLGGHDNAEAGLGPWRLAVFARAHAELEQAILSEQGFAAVRERIEGTRHGDEFLRRWEEFLRRHGHHARGEVEFLNPRWSERPDYVLDLVRGHLRGVGEVDPVAHRRRAAGERVELAAACRLRLRNPVKRLVFNYVLRQAQRASPVRENIKSESVRQLALMRRMLLELGGSLVWRRVLAGREDVFFLTLDELAPVAAGSAGFDVRELVAKRRAEYERDLSITPPSVVVGRFDPDNFVPDEVGSTLTEFTGVAVCPGVVQGPARVILQSGNEQVLPGEILVAPSTDPGWAPYFLNAAAIVMDVGGILSHGSIIAREYGIPTVVNVGPATRIIKTGQMLRVDGGRGEVRILG